MYTGLDNDPDMLATARELHANQPDAAFVEGDLRGSPPCGHFDIIYSCGVPLSHVTSAELTEYLTALCFNIRKNGKPTLAILDVLGRYSIEWTTKWTHNRWDYRMSFFVGGDSLGPATMTFHDSNSLQAAVREATTKSGCTVRNFRCFDRSISVGRHMTTGEFNGGLPDFRTRINQLYEANPDMASCLEGLRFPDHLPDTCPRHVADFFATYSSAWNYLLESAPSRVAATDTAEALRRLELAMQPGLGVGHTLIASAVIQP